MKQKLKLILGPIIIIATIAAFVWYVRANPAVIEQLRQTPIGSVIAVILLYGLVMAALVGILHASLLLYKKHMGLQENFLLNSYSSLVNFFGPGQSGPAMRTAYLKLKHGILIKQYVFATLIYYGMLAVSSGVILTAFAFPWWVTVLGALAVLGVSFVVIRWFLRKYRGVLGLDGASPRSLIKPFVIMGLATLAQVIIMVLIYFTELRAVDNTVGFTQALIYTGAANFALFVSITPGAIGFREAFLVFSQNLHGISSDTIIAANILDRAVYIIFLGLLFIIILSMHAGKKLHLKQVKDQLEQAPTAPAEQS